MRLLFVRTVPHLRRHIVYPSTCGHGRIEYIAVAERGAYREVGNLCN